MSTFNAGAIEASLTLDRSSWNRDLKELQAEVEKLEGKTINIGVSMDADEFYQGEAQVELMTEQMNSFSASITVDADAAKFFTEIDLVDETINAVSANDVVIGVETSGVPKTLAEFAELEVAAEIVDGTTIHMDVDYDRKNLEALVGSSAPGAVGSGGGGFMGFWQILILGVIALSPVLAVAVSAMTAALVGFVAATVAALGPLALAIGAFVLLIKYFKATDVAARTPAMRFLNGRLQDLLHTIHQFEKSDAAQAFFMAMGFALDAANTILARFVPLMDSLGQVVEQVAEDIAKFVQSKEFGTWIDFFSRFGLDMLTDFISIGGDLIRFLMNLFIAIKPFAKKLMSGLVGDFNDLANWSEHLGKDKGFREWLRTATKYGPMLLDMLEALWHAFRNIGEAIRPFAGPMILAITNLANAIADIPTDKLTLIIGLAVSVFAAFKTIGLVVGIVEGLSGAIGAVTAALGIGLGPLLLIIVAAAALAGILYYLWTTNEDFRNSLLSAWDDIKTTVMPIINDLVSAFQDEWPKIQQTAEDVWTNVQSIFEDAAGIIQQLVFFVTQAVTFIWSHFGDQIIKFTKATWDIALGVVKGAFQILAGLFAFINDLLHGRWGQLWGDIKQILRGAWTIIEAILKGALHILEAWGTSAGRVVTGAWHLLWGAIKDLTSAAIGWVKDKFGDFVGWLGGLGGRVTGAVKGLFSGIGDEFKSVINNMISWWNNLAFTVDIPNKIPGLPDSFTISTPNHAYLADGAYVTEPMNAIIGEGSEPEIVSPESKMAEIVARYSGRMDYRKMASSIMDALAPVLGSVLTHDMLMKILEKAGASVKVDAPNDDRSARALAAEIAWELRVAGYGGL